MVKSLADKEVKIGKINYITFGYGGYQGAMIGVTFDFGGKGWGVGHFKGFWSGKRSKDCKWSEQDRINSLGEMVMYLDKLMQEAKVSDITELKNIPVEVTFEDQKLVSWRILTEVL